MARSQLFAVPATERAVPLLPKNDAMCHVTEMASGIVVSVPTERGPCSKTSAATRFTISQCEPLVSHPLDILLMQPLAFLLNDTVSNRKENALLSLFDSVQKQRGSRSAVSCRAQTGG